MFIEAERSREYLQHQRQRHQHIVEQRQKAEWKALVNCVGKREKAKTNVN